MHIINFIRDLFEKFYPSLSYILPVLACICFYYLKINGKNSKKIISVLYYFIFLISSLVFIRLIITQLHDHKVWDFTAFYVYGKVALSGNNFYLPESFQAVFNTIDIPPLDYTAFIGEVINVGFVYPPPTILLFTPLGFFSYQTALTCWIIFNLFFIIGCIYLSYDLFLKKYKLNGFLLVTILFVLFQPVKSTIIFSQTNFIVLFFLLLMRKYSDKNFSGIFLAFAFFTKPYMIIFGLYFLVRKLWKPIIYCIVTSLILVGITILFFGIDPFSSYLFDNPAKRLPTDTFSYFMNQSLNAVLLRLHVISLGNSIYIYLALATIIVTLFYLFYLIRKKLYDYIWPTLLLVGLILYPGTLNYYGTLLLFIIFQFFDEEKDLGFNMFITIPLIAISYFLGAFYLFICLCFLLMIIILKSLNLKIFQGFDPPNFKNFKFSSKSLP